MFMVPVAVHLSVAFPQTDFTLSMPFEKQLVGLLIRFLNLVMPASDPDQTAISGGSGEEWFYGLCKSLSSSTTIFLLKSLHDWIPRVYNSLFVLFTHTRFQKALHSMMEKFSTEEKRRRRKEEVSRCFLLA